MCQCVNVELQSYSNQTVLYYPDWFVSGLKIRAAGIDNCILEEIKQLWESGVQTLESCCGHNKVMGYIAVVDESIPKMIELGYQFRHKDLGGLEENYADFTFNRCDIFAPKSV